VKRSFNIDGVVRVFPSRTAGVHPGWAGVVAGVDGAFGVEVVCGTVGVRPAPFTGEGMR
jgi:hypothetical protein